MEAGAHTAPSLSIYIHTKIGCAFQRTHSKDIRFVFNDYTREQ